MSVDLSTENSDKVYCSFFAAIRWSRAGEVEEGDIDLFLSFQVEKRIGVLFFCKTLKVQSEAHGVM